MDEKSEKLYLYTIQTLIKNLKDKLEFRAESIPYDNLELFIKESKIDGISLDDFSISFQKQNGSFTLVISSSMEEKKKNSIIDLITTSLNVNLFAIYNFSDLKDITTIHFVYDDEKIAFNKGILNDLNNMNQIENLFYAESLKESKSK